MDNEATYEIQIRVRASPKPGRSTTEMEQLSNENLLELLSVVSSTILRPLAGPIRCDIDGDGIKVIEL